MDETNNFQYGAGFFELNKRGNTERQKKIIIKSVIIFISIIIISSLITFSIYKYNQIVRNIQTPFFTAPYISLMVEIFSIIILL